jgi:hypothetical protein
MSNQKLETKDIWEILAGEADDHTRIVCPVEGARALEALLELEAKPALLVLDDLSGQNNAEWSAKLKTLESLFNIESPALPVHKRHAQDQESCGPRGGSHSDELLPILRFELQRLRRPLAALVDMQWVYCDANSADAKAGGQKEFKARWFGLELIRLLKRAKPSLPLFVWSPISDRQILQRAMQLGAASCFDKDPDLHYEHDLTGVVPDKRNFLTVGSLWFRILEWEATRYQCPPVGTDQGDFIIATTPSAVEAKERFLKSFHLTGSDLLKKPEPEVEQLLRSLVPEAVEVEILRFFGEGQSRAERPFVVRGRTSGGRWLRPVQIKLSRDWRALAKEGKGYRDVFASRLGPTVAHLLNGPFRKGEWCGMSQSFAAPEEAIRDIVSKSTRSVDDWLRKYLSDAAKCRLLVDEIFEGVLDPLYKENLSKTACSVFRAFDRVSPAHLEVGFISRDNSSGSEEVDFSPRSLSRKDEKSRREEAGRRWKKVETLRQSQKCVIIRGLEIESLEIDAANPPDSRLRLLDPTLGVKVDIKADSTTVARRWKSLAESPIKLVGMPVTFRLDPPTKSEENGNEEKKASAPNLLSGWTTSVDKLLRGSGILEVTASKGQAGDQPDSTQQEDDGGKVAKPEGVKFEKQPNWKAWERCANFFHPCHPIDWSEEFHIGPTHGDLNLGNILLHEKGDRLFPWLIDFDKAEDARPVVFDLAKLEIEAYHKIGQELFWELRQLGCVKSDKDARDTVHRFEAALARRGVADVRHLWARYTLRSTNVPESLQLRFDGFFAYLKQVHKRVDDLGISSGEFLLGRAVYTMCCLKFKHLYNASTHPNAPFPAKVLLWKLEALLDALDAGNGIIARDSAHDRGDAREEAVFAAVDAVRQARKTPDNQGLMELLSSVLNETEFKNLKALPDYAHDKGWTLLLRLVRDKQLRGKNRWLRELLWYARDNGLSKKAEELGEFIKAMVMASRPSDPDSQKIEPREISSGQFFKDYASTGRLGNTYPSFEMFKHLAQPDARPLIKISSRGESGGTIDVLEQAGIPVCHSEAEVNRSLDQLGWAVAEGSAHLCEVDKILMKLRKECGCMKVDDLTITSISAKKVVLGIRDFDVQIVTGYDSKFHSLLVESVISVISKQWIAVWKEVFSSGKLKTKSFDSSQLGSWKSKNEKFPIVFGKTILAAKVWQMLKPKQQTELSKRLPPLFIRRMKEIREVIEEIQKAASRPVQPLMDLPRVEQPSWLKKFRCWEFDGLRDDPDFESLVVLVLQFVDSEALNLTNISFWDGLFSEITKSGHPMAGILFGDKWVAILAPRADFPSSLQPLVWRILRDGF